MSNPSNKKVICIGDYMVDHFIYGNVSRISPEAPIPVLHQTSEFFTLGGTGNVVRNLNALGVSCQVLGIISNENSGAKAKELFEELSDVKLDLLIEASWSTPHKTRLSSNGQQLLRLDLEKENKLTKELEDKLLGKLEGSILRASLIILSDYNKGTLTDSLCQRVISLAKKYHVPVIVDPKGRDFTKYTGASIVTPNYNELKVACGKDPESLEDIDLEARRLLEAFNLNAMIVTLGARGMLVCEKDRPFAHIPTQARDVYDVSGAGDTVIAGLATYLSEGKSLLEAAQFANKAAGIVVGKIGTAVVRRDEVESTQDIDEKIMSLSSAAEKASLWKKQNKTVGFTNGCFDLLHMGHLHLLKQARLQCDKLIVAVNSDASVKRLKGEQRPIQSEYVRAHVLAALEIVDAVVVFEEDTPIRCIQHILPDVLIKGADYQIHQVVGGDIVENNGGKIFLAELKDGFSTTNTVNRLRAVQ